MGVHGVKKLTPPPLLTFNACLKYLLGLLPRTKNADPRLLGVKKQPPRLLILLALKPCWFIKRALSPPEILRHHSRPSTSICFVCYIKRCSLSWPRFVDWLQIHVWSSIVFVQWENKGVCPWDRICIFKNPKTFVSCIKNKRNSMTSISKMKGWGNFMFPIDMGADFWFYQRGLKFEKTATCSLNHLYSMYINTIDNRLLQ